MHWCKIYPKSSPKHFAPEVAKYPKSSPKPQNSPKWDLDNLPSVWTYYFALLAMQLVCADAFSLVSDASGRMSRIRLDMFIQELLILPAAVFESPSFEYNDGIALSLFDQVGCWSQFVYIV